MEPKPFATARIARTREYFENCYRELQRLRWFNRIAVPFGLFYVALGAWLVSKHPLGWVVLSIGIYLVFITHFRRWRWIRDRVLDVSERDDEMIFEFFQENILVTISHTVSQVDWQGIHKFDQTPTALIIWPQRGAMFYIPTDTIEPPDAIEQIIAKMTRPAN